MNATESLLALYRAARDFTRRAVSADALERAAIAHAEARGWRRPNAAGAERTLATAFARSTTRAGERVVALETAIRDVAERLDATDGQPNAWVVRDVVEKLRAVLG